LIYVKETDLNGDDLWVLIPLAEAGVGKQYLASIYWATTTVRGRRHKQQNSVASLSQSSDGPYCRCPGALAEVRSVIGKGFGVMGGLSKDVTPRMVR
jgi:hypothetical protein